MAGEFIKYDGDDPENDRPLGEDTSSSSSSDDDDDDDDDDDSTDGWAHMGATE